VGDGVDLDPLGLDLILDTDLVELIAPHFFHSG
jgi:hypothetical protein